MSSDSEKFMSAHTHALSLELKSDKEFLRKEVTSLRKEIKQLNKDHAKLLAKNARMDLWLAFYRDTNFTREIGVILLTVCGLLASIFTGNWRVLYYCLIVLAATSYFWGTWFNRKKPESEP